MYLILRYPCLPMVFGSLTNMRLVLLFQLLHLLEGLSSPENSINGGPMSGLPQEIASLTRGLLRVNNGYTT